MIVIYPEGDSRRNKAILPHKSKVEEYYGDMTYTTHYHKFPIKVKFINLVPVSFKDEIHLVHESFLKKKETSNEETGIFEPDAG